MSIIADQLVALVGVKFALVDSILYHIVPERISFLS